MGAGKLLSYLILNLTLVCMFLYIHNLPYIPLETDHTKVLRELPADKPLELLDPKTGHVAHQGWAKFPNKFLYNPSMSNAYVPVFNRKKFWNYFNVITDSYLVTMAHVDLGLVKASYINIKDIKDLTKPAIEIKVEDLLGKHVTIEGNKNGKGLFSTINHENLNMTFYKRPENDWTNIRVSGKSSSGLIKANFTVDSKDVEGMSWISAFPGNPTRHNFNTKIPLLKFAGDLSIEGKKLFSCSESAPCLGLLDSGRGFFPYIGRWIWGTSAFRAGGHDIAINFGYTADDPNASADAVFIDGKLHKLDSLIMKEVTADHWTWERHPQLHQHKDVSIDLEFRRSESHSIGDNFLFFFMNLKSNFGHFSGSIKVNGETINFDNVFGFIEDFHARW